MNPERHDTAVPEILPPKNLERGSIGTLEEELDRLEEKIKKLGGYSENIQWLEVDPILTAQQEGFKYILRLPRDNETGCVAKYGRYYDKMQSYHDFIVKLARINNIARLKHLHDSYYVFTTREDAELLKSKLKEKQQATELEFEIIDSKPSETH